LKKSICGKEKEVKNCPILLFWVLNEGILAPISFTKLSKKLEPLRSRASITFSQDFCDTFLGRLLTIAIIPMNTKNIDPFARPRRISNHQMIKASFDENCIGDIYAKYKRMQDNKKSIIF
jgi:hypothetical protein